VTQSATSNHLPSHVAMAWPTLCAIKRAGGSASNAEIIEAVAENLNLDDRQRTTPLGRGSRTLLDYRLAWSRTFLKNMGAITNDARSRWSITEAGRRITPGDIKVFSDKLIARLRETDEARQGGDA
jgi:restriction system protein